MNQPTQLGRRDTSGWRTELVWLFAEIGALFVVFIIAFTGRDHFSDTVKSVLSGLSVIIGVIGVAVGLIVVARGLKHQSTLKWRLPLGGLMMFFGGYTIMHILG